MWIRSSTVTYVHLGAAANAHVYVRELNRCDVRKASFTEVAFVPRYSSSTTGQFTWDAIWFCSHLEFVSLSDASVWRLTKIELIFCTTFYMQQQQARIGVSEMRGSYMVTLRLHVVTIVTPDRWVWSRYKAKYSHIGHTRLMWLRSQGSPFWRWMCSLCVATLVTGESA